MIAATPARTSAAARVCRPSLERGRRGGTGLGGLVITSLRVTGRDSVTV